MPDTRFSLPEDHDRLTDLGRLAGGLVHELKNPLGVILLNTELMLGQIAQAPLPSAERERAEKRLRRIGDSARNLQGIVQTFLAYARPNRPDPDAVDVNALLTRLIDEQSEQLDAAQVTVNFHPDDGLALVPADLQHMRSIFLNVIANAREALTERAADRRLLIVTRSGQDMARVVIANNGPPLPEKVAAHLFEPFTSTKEGGTGLGLAIIRRLVELHGGTVTVSSDVHQGVSFTFEFPTPLGLARARTELPMPEAEATIVGSEGPGGPPADGEGAGADRSADQRRAPAASRRRSRAKRPPSTARQGE